MASENICKFNKFGFCKFKSECKYKHVNMVCVEENCDPKTCEKRHPKNCKYFVNSGDFMLGSNCAYAHKNDKNLKIKLLEQKIDGLLKTMESKEKIIDQLVNDVKRLKSIVEQTEFDGRKVNDENVTLEENEIERYDKETVNHENQNKDFININLGHLDKMENEIEKSRKNLRIKFKKFSDRKEGEIEKYNLLPIISDKHQQVLWQLEEFLESPETNDDKEIIMKVIECCRSKYNEMLSEFES